MRLNKFIAHSGITSRRKADELIKKGKVKINQSIITELGAIVGSEDVVTVDDYEINLEKNKVYIMLNKPAGYLSSVSDNRGRKTVLDIVSTVNGERIYPVGRLDYETEGLLLLTNDGELANRVIHPKNEIEKIYYVELNKPLLPHHIVELEKGIILDGYKTKGCKINIANNENSRKKWIITIFEGRNRQIRKMFESQNIKVLYLKRIKIGKIDLKNLKLGEYRNLTNNELEYLMNIN